MVSVNNSLYVHFPKTGGTFVREILKPFGAKRVTKEGFHSGHLPLKEVNSDRYDFVFATVRNPLDWYGSAWKFLKQFIESDGEFNEDNPLEPIYKHYSPDFNEFVRNVIVEYKSYYSDAFFDYTSGGYVNSYLRTEVLSYDLCRTMASIGLSFDESQVISKPIYGQRIIPYSWNEKLKRDVIRRESKIIDTFYL